MKREHPPTKSHNYVAKIFSLPPSVFSVDQVNEVEINHDAWCDFKVAGGYCNCDPVVHLKPRQKAQEVN